MKVSLNTANERPIITISSTNANICTDLLNIVPLVSTSASLITFSKFILNRRHASGSPCLAPSLMSNYLDNTFLNLTMAQLFVIVNFVSLISLSGTILSWPDKDFAY
jgi:hypothetical protein